MRSKQWVWLLPMLLVEVVGAVPPRIISQSGSLDLREGDCFTAYVEAEGDSPGYQWYRDGELLAGQADAVFSLAKVMLSDAGAYHVAVSNAGGEVRSDPLTLGVTAVPVLGISPGSSGVVSVPGHPAYYEVYLPSSYGGRTRAFPVLFTFNPGGGGMVGHFRGVAEEKQWIVVGVSQSRNGQGFQEGLIYNRAVFRHAIDHLKIDPSRIFVSGMSGGGWSSFEAAKRYAPFVAGVFSMGGWLGQQYSHDRDIYLTGLLVARGNGDADAGANYWLGSDRNYLTNWISSGNIRDWSFPGGHVSSPQSVQREVFDWFLSLTTASSGPDLDFARGQEALWKAQITAGEGREVLEELVYTAFNLPRTPDALAAWKTIDFLFAHPDLFLRGSPPDFADFPRRNFLAVKLYHELFAFMHHRDPSMQFSAVAAARALGDVWVSVQDDPESERGNILRHPAHTCFDGFVLENALHARSESPLAGDWDGDGRDNFGEFVLGTSPLVPDGPAQPEIRLAADGVHASLSGCRTGAMVRLAPMVTTDPRSVAWSEASFDEASFLLRPDGTSSLDFRLADPAAVPSVYARFRPSVLADSWHDANRDGIPHEYQFPGVSPGGDSPDLADARGIIEVPGGAPLYLRYLTAAEIGAVGNSGASLRYHPALAGYRGCLYHEIWMDVTASSIADAQAAVLGRPPNEVRLITSSEAPWFSDEGTGVMGDRYFERTRGYVVPDITGNHVFSIAGDDDCELWFSSRGTPATATRIASVSGWTNFRDFTKSATQSSAPISLRAGSSYYVEILHREGVGGDHCSVSWITPGNPNRVIIPSSNLRCLAVDLIDAAGE